MPRRSGTRSTALSLTARRAHEPGPLQVRRSLRHAGESGRQRHAHLLRTRARSRAWSGMRRTTSTCTVSYGQGLRDADVRRARLRPVRPGLNFDARSGDRDRLRGRLEVAAGADASASTSRCSRPDTKQEIVVNTATGGRTTYRNAGDTRRRGVEAEWDGDLGAGFTRARQLHVAARGVRRGLTSSGTPPVVVPAGPRLPGVPPQQAYGVLNWMPGGCYGFNAVGRGAVRGQASTSTTATPRSRPRTRSATRGSGFAQSAGSVKFTEYVRVNNITEREVHRLGDRRRHQRALFRAGAGTQLVRRRERRVRSESVAARSARIGTAASAAACGGSPACGRIALCSGRSIRLPAVRL